MSVAALSTTTTSAAITKTQVRFQVASTTGINGAGSLTSPQSLLVIGNEAMLVRNVPVSGVVEVVRGFDGTEPKAHVSGATVYFGARERFTFNIGPWKGTRVGLIGDAADL